MYIYIYIYIYNKAKKQTWVCQINFGEPKHSFTVAEGGLRSFHSNRRWKFGY